MDRRMFDTGLPMLYGIVIVVLAMTVGGRPVGIFAAVGAMMLGLYYAAIRPGLIRRERADDTTTRP